MKSLIITFLVLSTFLHISQYYLSVLNTKSDDLEEYCSCINYRDFDVKKDFKSHDYVFTAKVDTVITRFLDKEYYREFTFKIFTSYKNDVGSSQIKVITPEEASACGVFFDKNHLYTIFLNKYGKYIITENMELENSFLVNACMSKSQKFNIATICKLDKLGKKFKKQYNEYDF